MIMNEYTFVIHFADADDVNFALDLVFSCEAPHYEGAVTQALIMGQQVLREYNNERTLYMRVCQMSQ